MWEKRLFLFFGLLSLVLLLVPACGGDEEEISTPIATVTTTTTATPTSTPSPTAAHGPVKIGAIAPWSGPSAATGGLINPIIQLVEHQVQDMGGILGGREVKIFKYDNRANVAEARAGALKLAYDEKVSVLTIGGISGAERQAVASFAQENKMLFVSFSEFVGLSENQFSVNAASTIGDAAIQQASVAKALNAKTVAILSTDWESMRTLANVYKETLKAADIKIVYEEYPPIDTTDFLPYLTKIKYEKPDMLMLGLAATENMVAVAKQIGELGGWGDIIVTSGPGGEYARKQAGAQGWYTVALFIPGMENQYPGAAKFIDDFQALIGRTPDPNMVYWYNSFWTAIYAIEMAGTDNDLAKIAQMARSGNLEWDTPIGHAHFTTDGQSNLHYGLGRIENNNLVNFVIPQ